jgi:hypothetical protein
MRVRWAPLLALLLSLGFFGFLVSLWLDQATPLERHYLLDYARQQFGIGRIPLITPKDSMPLPWLRDSLYGGQDIQHLLLWQILAGIAVAFFLLFLARQYESARLEEQANGKVIRGPRLVSHRQFNFRTIFKRKGAFYIETR